MKNSVQELHVVIPLLILQGRKDQYENSVLVGWLVFFNN